MWGVKGAVKQRKMKNIFEDLLNKYLLEKITKEETKQFFNMLDEPEYEELLKAHIGKDFLEDTYNEREDLIRRERIKHTLAALMANDKKPARIFSMQRIAAAASIVLILSTGAYFLFFNTTQKQIAKTGTQQQFKNDMAPGGNKAVLTLADGTQIILDSAANGTISQQGNTKIIKLDDGQLAYNAANSNGEVLYNTISTPKGGQYQIVLPDKSKVWLNAASSLRFPASFTGKDRNVELTGEGYFEIAKNTAMPFFVKVNGMQVEVLGTHFNVNAYDDEAAMKTTLLEGSVKVNKGTANIVLKPGQQTILNSNGQLGAATAVNIDEIVAWKDGWFHFESADLKTILRQFARWYDVEIIYEGPVKNRKFFAVVKRSSTLKNVLEMLQDNNIVYRIEEKKLIVKSG